MAEALQKDQLLLDETRRDAEATRQQAQAEV